MEHGSIMFNNDNPYEDAQRSEVNAISSEFTKWMTEALKRTFVVQFRSRVARINQFWVMADMNITEAQYADLKLWYVRSKNYIPFGPSKKIEFCFMYAESEAVESEDDSSKKTILNVETRVSTKEMIGNKYGTVHVCMKDLKDHSDKLDNVLHEQATLTMDQVEDGNGIEYANTTYEPGHSPSCVINEPQYSLCELEYLTATQIMDRAATIDFNNDVDTLFCSSQLVAPGDQYLVQFPGSVVAEQLERVASPGYFHYMTRNYEQYTEDLPRMVSAFQAFSYPNSSSLFNALGKAAISNDSVHSMALSERSTD
ncbi:hypothetical protein F5879DRAFT_984204 [Lentinula edodes]|nr:hypothetical protein F5879DRAFT_984204 [Lentinula edodes]